MIPRTPFPPWCRREREGVQIAGDEGLDGGDVEGQQGEQKKQVVGTGKRGKKEEREGTTPSRRKRAGGLLS